MVTREILERMFEDFKRSTKELFFDELDEKFRDFEQGLEGRSRTDQLLKRLALLEQWRDELKPGVSIPANLSNTDRHEDPHQVASVSAQLLELKAKVDRMEQEAEEQKSRAKKELGRLQTLKSDSKVQQVKISKVLDNPQQVNEKRFNEFRDQMQKFINDMTEDLLRLREYVYQSASGVEARLRQEIEEVQMTTRALYVQENEL